MYRKILIIKPSSFGDIVQANPTVVALKKAYPESTISFLVFNVFKDLVALFPDADRRIVWRKDGGMREYLRVRRLIRRKKFDLVIDLQGLLRTGALAAASNGQKVIGVPGLKECSNWLIKEVYPQSRSLNAVERSLETVRYLTGKKEEAVFRIAVSEDLQKESDGLLAQSSVRKHDLIVSLIPNARGKHKVWPAHHYDELVEHLISLPEPLRPKVIVLGGSSDKGLVTHPGAIDLCGMTGIGQLAGILKRSTAVVGGDTGPLHLAAALDVPVIALFGGSDVNETAPTSPVAVIIKKSFACSPCRSRPVCGDYPCLAEIKPIEVFDQVRKVIERELPSHG